MQPILKISLTTHETSEYAIPAEWQRDYLGGASLAARLLYDSLTRGLTPLSADAPLLFLNGPLSGTLAPTVGRFVVCGKSPLTGLWAESNCGGFWGPEETQESIKKELGVAGTRVACVGPAAENGVLFAGIFCDHGRTAGRTGLGAVMASKNLKAIAVKGSGKIPLADAETYNTLRGSSNRALKSDTQTRVLHELGTSGVTDYADYLGSLPKKYYSLGVMEGVEKVSGAAMAETILAGTSACHGCVIACGRVVNLGGGKQKGPEYETVVGLGPNLLIRDLGAITRLMDLCDRYGMDTISTGNTIGLAMQLFERGIISEKDTGGLVLKWGDEETVARHGRVGFEMGGRGDGCKVDSFDRAPRGFRRPAGARFAWTWQAVRCGGGSRAGQRIGSGLPRPARGFRHGAGLRHQSARRVP